MYTCVYIYASPPLPSRLDEWNDEAVRLREGALRHDGANSHAPHVEKEGDDAACGKGVGEGGSQAGGPGAMLVDADMHREGHNKVERVED